jgi:hypothetical protein
MKVNYSSLCVEVTIWQCGSIDHNHLFGIAITHSSKFVIIHLCNTLEVSKFSDSCNSEEGSTIFGIGEFGWFLIRSVAKILWFVAIIKLKGNDEAGITVNCSV